MSISTPQVNTIEHHESFSSKKWIIAVLLAVAIIALSLFYEYDQSHNAVSLPRLVSLEGKLTPFSSEHIITQVGKDHILYYRIINPIEPYNEVYIFSEPGKGEVSDMVMYAKEKISCPGTVKITGREMNVEINAMVSGGKEGGTRGETQVLIDGWECGK